MIDAIYYPPRFFRQLGLLQRSGKEGSAAASQAEKIISTFQKQCLETELIKRRRTQKGEKRLKNCYKYNLGSGYRLLTIRTKSYLLLLAVGTHDDINLFIEEQRKNKFSSQNYLLLCQHIPISPDSKSKDMFQFPSPPPPNPDLYELQLQERMTDQMLQTVFPCFYKSSTKT